MSKAKILVVEDQEDLAKIIKMNLEQDGYEVSLVLDGQGALTQIAEKIPDLIILDIMLPKIDGWEVLSQIRTNRETKDCPVIILTAKAEETSKLLGYNLGADDYVTKPFSVRELSARIKAMLKRVHLSELKKEEHKGQLAKIPVLADSRETKLIDQEETVYIDCVHNYIYVHTFEDKHLADFTLTEIEKKLAPFFMRIHKSYIVNLHQLLRIFSPRKSSYRVVLGDKTETELPVSRQKIKELRKMLRDISGLGNPRNCNKA